MFKMFEGTNNVRDMWKSSEEHQKITIREQHLTIFCYDNDLINIFKTLNKLTKLILFLITKIYLLLISIISINLIVFYNIK